MNRNRHKTTWQTRIAKFVAFVGGVNALAKDLNAHGSIRPIRTIETLDGCMHVWEPWESPFSHPWRVWQPDPGVARVNVAGGRVHRGDASATVTGLTNLTLVDGLKIWLRVRHYYNHATDSVYDLQNGTGAWPTDDNTATLSTTILPVAEISGTTLYQYLYEDQTAPRIDPPLPDLTGTYYRRVVAGVVQWIAAGTCSSASGSPAP